MRLAPRTLEMNALLATWMHEVGPAATLLVAKSVVNVTSHICLNCDIICKIIS